MAAGYSCGEHVLTRRNPTDPLLLRRYPAPKPDLEGVAIRLDVEPRE
jgi:hypothetical protein